MKYFISTLLCLFITFHSSAQWVDKKDVNGNTHALYKTPVYSPNTYTVPSRTKSLANFQNQRSLSTIKKMA